MLRSIQIIEYMRRDPFTLSPGMSIRDAVHCLLEQRLSAAPVVNDGALVGMFSESDGLKGALDASYHGAVQGNVDDYMGREVHSLVVTATVQDAAELFLRHHRRSMPVVDGRRLVGQLSRNDILRAALVLAPGNDQAIKL